MRGPRARLALLVALVVGSGVLALVGGLPSVDAVRDLVARAGWAGPPVFALLYAVLVLAPVPATVLTIAAGVLFGVPVGLPVVMVGALLGAVAAFALSRRLGRAAVVDLDNARVRQVDDLVRRRGPAAVIGLRLVPLLPFAALNYACGLSALRIRDYLVGTAVGILPAATAYTTVGAYGATPGSVPFVLAVGGIAVLVVGGAVAAHRRRRRSGASRAAPP